MLKSHYLGVVSKHSGNAVRVVCVRAYSEQYNVINNYETSALRRGDGSRSSFNGIICTVFGCTGFLGNYLTAVLGRKGTQLVLPHRGCGDDYETKRLKLTGDLGQTTFLNWNLKDYNSIKKAVKYSDVVVNLTGRLFETKNYKLHDVHTKGARDIARACKECGVPRLIHLSHISSSPNAKNQYMWKPWKYLESKYHGEQAVMEEFPDATIIKSSIMYGRGDYFFWKWNCNARRMGGGRVSRCIVNKGEGYVRQPVSAEDVAEAVYQCILEPATKGRTVATVGPYRHYLSDISEWNDLILEVDKYTGIPTNEMRHDAKYDIIFSAMVLFLTHGVKSFIHFPVWGLYHEQLEFEAITDKKVSSDMITLEDLGITPKIMHEYAPHLFFPTFFFATSEWREKWHTFPTVKPPPIARD